jgi:hypothetical protein
VLVNGVIGVVKKFVATLLVLRTFLHSQAHQWMLLFLVVSLLNLGLHIIDNLTYIEDPNETTFTHTFTVS